MSAPLRPRQRQTPQARQWFILAGVTFATLAAACGGERPARKKDVAADLPVGPTCTTADSTPVGLAVLEYITTAFPTPQRYLQAAGTDSAVPEDGFKIMQLKGPTYYYSSDPKAQQQVKDKLASVGPYATLLVVYKGKTEKDNGNDVTVSLAGHYVGGDHDGKVAEAREINLRCDTTGWRVTNPKEKPKAPGDSAKPTAPPAAASGPA